MLPSPIETLNSILVVSYDTDMGDVVYTVKCEDNASNREKISYFGYSDKVIDRFTDGDGKIEMTHFAWTIAKSATLGDGFICWNED